MSTYVVRQKDADGSVIGLNLLQWLCFTLAGNPHCSQQNIMVSLGSSINQGIGKNNIFQVDNKEDFFSVLHTYDVHIFSLLETAEKDGFALISGPSKEGTEKLFKIKYADLLKEVEEYYLISNFTIFRFLQLTDQRRRIIKNYIEFLTCGFNVKDFRLKQLMNLFNICLTKNFASFDVLLATAKYAQDSEQFDIIIPYISQFDSWFVDMEFLPHEIAQLHKICALGLEKAGFNNSEHTYEQFYRWAASYEASDPRSVELVQDIIEAGKCLIVQTLVANTYIYYDSIMDLYAVKKVKDSQHGALYKILSMLHNGTITDQITCVEAEFKKLQSYNISHDNLMLKIKFNHLLDVINATTSHMISINEIAKQLQIPYADTEELIIKCISQGTIDAKIDQYQKCLFIKSSVQKKFDKYMWKNLRSRLTKWREAVTDVLAETKRNLHGHDLDKSNDATQADHDDEQQQKMADHIDQVMTAEASNSKMHMNVADNNMQNNLHGDAKIAPHVGDEGRMGNQVVDQHAIDEQLMENLSSGPFNFQNYDMNSMNRNNVMATENQVTNNTNSRNGNRFNQNAYNNSGNMQNMNQFPMDFLQFDDKVSLNQQNFNSLLKINNKYMQQQVYPQQMNEPQMNEQMNEPQMNAPQMNQQMNAQQMNAQQMNAPQMNSPQMNAPQMNAPQMNSPHMNSPHMNSPQMNSPQMNAPQMNAPQMNAPQMNAPQMNSPQMNAPQMNSPQMNAPQMNALQMNAPQMNAPQMNAPQMNAPQMNQQQIHQMQQQMQQQQMQQQMQQRQMNPNYMSNNYMNNKH